MLIREMAGRNIGKSMTKEDYHQVMNAQQFLVPMKTFRSIQSLAVPIAITTIPEDSNIDTSIMELRKKEREQEEKMANVLATHTIQEAVKIHLRERPGARRG